MLATPDAHRRGQRYAYRSANAHAGARRCHAGPDRGGPVPAGKVLRMQSPEYGAQVFLWWQPATTDRDLQLVKDGGFTWVKQNFSWVDIEGAAKGALDWSEVGSGRGRDPRIRA